MAPRSRRPSDSGPPATRRVTLDLPAPLDDALAALVERGLHGVTKSQVAVALLSRELEQLVRHGFLTSGKKKSTSHRQ